MPRTQKEPRGREVDKCKTPSSGTFLRRYGVEVMGWGPTLGTATTTGFNVDSLPQATQPIFLPLIFNTQTFGTYSNIPDLDKSFFYLPSTMASNPIGKCCTVGVKFTYVHSTPPPRTASSPSTTPRARKHPVSRTEPC